MHSYTAAAAQVPELPVGLAVGAPGGARHVTAIAAVLSAHREHLPASLEGDPAAVRDQAGSSALRRAAGQDALAAGDGVDDRDPTAGREGDSPSVGSPVRREARSSACHPPGMSGRKRQDPDLDLASASSALRSCVRRETSRDRARSPTAFGAAAFASRPSKARPRGRSSSPRSSGTRSGGRRATTSARRRRGGW